MGQGLESGAGVPSKAWWCRPELNCSAEEAEGHLAIASQLDSQPTVHLGQTVRC
jgi:hypothetical protein